MEPKTRRETFLNNAANGDSSLTPITREESFINKIAEAVESGGGSSLPPVTSSDNGKVLGVDNGQWGAQDRFAYVLFGDCPNLMTHLMTGITTIFSRMVLYGDETYNYSDYIVDSDSINELRNIIQRIGSCLNNGIPIWWSITGVDGLSDMVGTFTQIMSLGSGLAVRFATTGEYYYNNALVAIADMVTYLKFNGTDSGILVMRGEKILTVS